VKLHGKWRWLRFGLSVGEELCVGLQRGSALSRAASSSPRVVKFVDRYMKDGRNILSGYDASEGALYILFLAVLAAHPEAPLFCAVDNADHGLNPGLAKALMEKFADWVLKSKPQRQILITSHNPAVLDGLPLQTIGFDYSR